MYSCTRTYFKDESGKATLDNAGGTREVLYVNGAIISDEEAVKVGLKDPTGDETFEDAPAPRPYRNVREVRLAAGRSKAPVATHLPSVSKPVKPVVPQMNAPVAVAKTNETPDKGKE
jgi:hypothetical protein